MKNIILLMTSFTIATLFTHCSSAQFDKKAPFTIAKAYHQDWVGGMPGSQGTLVTIELAADTSTDIAFDSIFFGKKKLKLERVNAGDKTMITANFIRPTAQNKNIIMHADPKKEMANKVPDVVVDFPFELSDNECVISYINNNKKRYYKIENLKKGKPIYYP